MKYSISKASLISVAIVVSLFGCANISSSIEDTFASSCKGIPQVQQGYNLRIGGVEVPFKPGGPIKIGKLEFDKSDGATVSDAIFALSESRQRQCSYLAAALLGKPRPSGAAILQVLSRIDATGAKVDSIVADLSDGAKDPKQVAARAEQAAQTAKQEEEAAKRNLLTEPKSGKVGYKDLAEDVAADIRLSRDVPNVKVELSNVQQRLLLIGASISTQRVIVGGFEAGGVALSSQMKEALAKQFSSVVGSFRQAGAPRVAIVGFADETGSYIQNIDIGLRRAQSVVAYLERSYPQQLIFTIVASGGVQVGSGARRVDILIS